MERMDIARKATIIYGVGEIAEAIKLPTRLTKEVLVRLPLMAQPDLKALTFTVMWLIRTGAINEKKSSKLFL